MNNRMLSNILRILIFIITICFLFSCAHKQPQPYKNFEELSLQLNTPPLINNYQQKYFKWASNEQGGGCVGANGIVDIGVNLKECPPSYIFYNKGKGNCGAFTTFAIYFLRKAGYEAYPMYVYWKWSDSLAPGHHPRDYHIMVLYKDRGNWYTMDNGLTNPKGIRGPFNNLEELPYKVLRIEKDY